jgi:hypothetical protein
VNRVDEAIDYFRKTVSDRSGEDEKLVVALENLAKQYELSGKTEQQKRVFEVLLKYKRSPDSSFRVAAKLIEIDLLKQNYESAQKRLQALVLPKSSEPETKITALNLKKLVRETAVRNHEIYRKSITKEADQVSLKTAEQLYIAFLIKFELEPAERNAVRMYLAEASIDLNKPDVSAKLYKAVIQEKDPTFAQDAAERWVGSIDAALKLQKANGEKPGAEPTDLERDYVAAADLLEKAIPDSKQSLESRLKAAQILAQYPSEKQEAMVRAYRLAQSASSSRQGVAGALVLLEKDPTRKNLDAVKALPLLLDTDRKWKGELAKKIEDLNHNFRILGIEDLEKSENYAEVAKGYEGLAKDAATEKGAEVYYAKAIAAHARSGSSADVFRVTKEWSSRFPKSKTIQPEMNKLGSIFFIRGRFNDAAELYLAIARQFKDYKSYQIAGKLFEGGKQPKKAVDAYQLALTLAKKDEDRAEIQKQMIGPYFDLKDELAVMNTYKACFTLSSSYQAECGTDLANRYLLVNDVRQADAILNQVVSIRKGPSAKSDYIAYAQYKLAKNQEVRLKKVPLKFPYATFEKSVIERIDELTGIMKVYQKALKMGGPWVISAYERLVDLRLELVADMETTIQEHAKEISPEQRKGLENIIANYKQEALNDAAKAYQGALKSGLLSTSLPKLHDILVNEGAEGFVRAQGQRTGLKLYGMDPQRGKDENSPDYQKVREILSSSVAEKNPEEIANAWLNYGNLLWGSGKPGLAEIAYGKADQLKGKKAETLVNLAVIKVSDYGYEDWFAANAAMSKWKQALKIQPNNASAIYNIGHYYNYFRLFSLAFPYFKKIEGNDIADIHDGLAVASEGTGKIAEADLHLRKAEDLGKKSKRFVNQFIRAARVESDPSECRSILSKMDDVKALIGFEQQSHDRLMARCKK